MPGTSRLFILPLLLAISSAGARQADDLGLMSLEQLGDVVVTSVSRQEERLSNAAAAIYIISSSDIARSGARSLPEALRLAPNLQVARANAREYAVTARGFNSVLVNKLLVLIDGRSLYSPLTSGVFWEVQDVVMADIERIEVISGPGATIYGANAVNGVINIITKSAKDTQAGMVAAGAGEQEKAATLRYGGKLANNGHYRVYAQAMSVDDLYTAAGVNTETGMRRSQAGFRADWDLDGAGLGLSGDVYRGRLGQQLKDDVKIAGANLTSRYNATLAGGDNLQVVLIVDHIERNQPTAIDETLNTIDLQAQHNMRLGQRHRVSWGGGYRYSMERIVNSTTLAFVPGDLNMHWGNLFLQDEIALGDQLKLTVGAKAEHNSYTGMEYLPNMRIGWTPGSAQQLVWASLARSVRAPSRVDRDLYAPVTPPLVNGVPTYTLGGGPNFVSETADVLEIGYRAQASAAFSYSVTAFYAYYDKLATLEVGKTARFEFENRGKGRNRGVEAWARWQVGANWRLTGGLAFQDIDTSLYPGSLGVAGFAGLATADPRRRWMLRSSHDLSATQQVDLSLRHNGPLKTPSVPGYYELDAHWLWKIRPDLELSLTGQNLLHASHPEFGALNRRSLIERTALLKLVKRF